MSEMPPSVPPSMPPPPGGGYAPPPPPPPSGGPASSDRTIMLVLSYLGILALIPLLTKKDDPEVQWHAKNGLAIFVAWIVISIVWAILQAFLPDTLGCALSFVSCGISIAGLAVVIIAIMKAVKGDRLRLPVISDFADKM
jgi:fumarate reductase subunit D